MRTISMLGTAAIFFVVGAIQAEADGLTVPHKWRHAAISRHADWRAEYKAVQPNAPKPAAPGSGYVDYRSVGLSDNPDDCNRGCALSNGG
jgi:hypothetical protein